MIVKGRSSFFRLGSLLFLVVLLGSACGDGDQTQPTPGEETPAEEPIRVGLALPGPIDDGAFNQDHYEGIQRAENEFGIEVSFQDNLAEPQQIVDALRNLAQANDVVIAAGGQMADPLLTVAPQSPDVDFALTAGVAEGENIHSFVKNFAEQSYVAGVLAATISETKKVGYIGGLEIPPTLQAEAGMGAGVEDTDSSVVYVSTSIGSFNDAAAAKEAATAQIDSDVDVLQAFVDAAAPGVIEAVNEVDDDILVIGGGQSEALCEASPKVLGVAPNQQAAVVFRIVEQYVDGELPPFEEITLATLDQPDLDASFVICPGHETEELIQLEEQTIQAILEGSVEVPTES